METTMIFLFVAGLIAPLAIAKRRSLKGLHPIRISRSKMLVLLLLVMALATTYNTAKSLGLLSAQPFPGSSLFTVAATYQYGNSPTGSVITPGGTVPFTLTVQSSSNIVQSLKLSFNATNPADWTGVYCTSATYPNPAVVPRFFTMTISGTSNVVPIDFQPTSPCDANYINTVSMSVTVSTNPGINHYTGTISAATNTPADVGFSLEWFGTPQ